MLLISLAPLLMRLNMWFLASRTNIMVLLKVSSVMSQVKEHIWCELLFKARFNLTLQGYVKGMEGEQRG